MELSSKIVRGKYKELKDKNKDKNRQEIGK